MDRAIFESSFAQGMNDAAAALQKQAGFGAGAIKSVKGFYGKVMGHNVVKAQAKAMPKNFPNGPAAPTSMTGPATLKEKAVMDSANRRNNIGVLRAQKDTATARAQLAGGAALAGGAYLMGNSRGVDQGRQEAAPFYARG